MSRIQPPIGPARAQPSPLIDAHVYAIDVLLHHALSNPCTPGAPDLIRVALEGGADPNRAVQLPGQTYPRTALLRLMDAWHVAMRPDVRPTHRQGASKAEQEQAGNIWKQLHAAGITRAGWEGAHSEAWYHWATNRGFQSLFTGPQWRVIGQQMCDLGIEMAVAPPDHPNPERLYGLPSLPGGTALNIALKVMRWEPAKQLKAWGMPYHASQAMVDLMDLLLFRTVLPVDLQSLWRWMDDIAPRLTAADWVQASAPGKEAPLQLLLKGVAISQQKDACKSLLTLCEGVAWDGNAVLPELKIKDQAILHGPVRQSLEAMVARRGYRYPQLGHLLTQMDARALRDSMVPAPDAGPRLRL